MVDFRFRYFSAWFEMYIVFLAISFNELTDFYFTVFDDGPIIGEGTSNYGRRIPDLF